MDDHFDFIIAGGGAAGLLLAYRLVHHGYDDSSILVVDREKKGANDRTWCFWIDHPFPFDPVVHRRWKQMWFHGSSRSHRFDLAPFEYRMIRGEDFYSFVLSDLEKRENVVFLSGDVAEIRDAPSDEPPEGARGATITLATGERFSGDWVFDSLFLPKEFSVDTRRYRFLKQHFLGWVIETEEAVFDADAVTLFDLDIPQDGAFRFMYILPFSGTKALVEYTFFSRDLLSKEEYELGLREYLDHRLGVKTYRVTEEETGIIPMTDQPFPRRGGERILRIGTKGGRVKSSTGFAFRRMVRDAERIVDSLRRHGHPFDIPEPPRRYRTFDGMLLSILDENPDRGREIFTDLFEKNPLGRIWRFLDEEGTIRENLALMASVPWWPFIAAWFDVKRRRLGIGGTS